VTEAALAVGEGSLWGVYVASQLAMIACLWAAWRLGREMLTPGAALLCALVLECCLYYHFTTSEVNNNVALYPFWALSVLFFYRALETAAARHWIATGACLGVGLLAKYSMVMLLVPMVAFMIVSPRARRHVATPGPYLALGAAVVVFAPHLLWAGRQHFPALQWALERTRGEEYSGSRIVNVLWFLKDQLPAVVPMLAVLLPLTGWRWRLRQLDPAERFQRDFLGPLVAQVVLALALDLKLRSMYGSQLWTFTGVLLLFSLVLRPEASRWRGAAIGCIVVGVLMVVAAVFYDQAWPYVRGKPMSIHFPGHEAAVEVAAVWRRHTDRPLRIVAGEWWLAGNVALYSRPRLQVYGGGPHAGHALFSPQNNPWTSDEALRKNGGIILWNADRQESGIARYFCERFPTLQLLDPVALRWETGAAVPPIRLGMALVPPGSDEAATGTREGAPPTPPCPRAALGRHGQGDGRS
jgi:4-amino-4-deoxy-L-arabinose transferase-like glycosyltransferase